MKDLSAPIRSYVADYLLVLGDARRGIPHVLALMFVVASLDLIGISLIAPLTQVIYAGSVPDFIPSQASRPRLIFLGLGSALVMIFAFKGWLAFHLNRRILLFSEGHRAGLMERLVGAYQAMDWQTFVARKASDVISQTHGYTGAYAGGTLAASIWLATNALIFVLLVALLSLRDFKAVLVVVACLGIYAAVIHRPLQRAQTAAQRRFLTSYEKTLNTVSQALGAMREVRVLGHEAYFRAEVRDSATQLAEATAWQSSLSQVPRLAVEAVMVLVIILIAGIRFAAEGTAEPAVTTLAVFAVAGIRLIPAATAIMVSVNGMRSTRFVLRNLAAELAVLKAQESDVKAGEATVVLRAAVASDRFRDLRLDGVTFTYRGARQPALTNVGLIIRAGETVGLMGRSGAGKSTVADLILGFLVPQAGQVLVNGRNIHEALKDWLRYAAYIPQTPYLLDDTFRRNIAFGAHEDRIDPDRLENIIDRVQLRELVDQLPQGLNTRIGERGAMLSGGQRQRLALARALYQGRQFLILDEATSALDEDTEREVLGSVRSLHGKTTMLIIAHSERTLAMCDRIERL